MSRIRSIHPGLWTDDAFMSLSAFARLLYIGLLNEAWDDGVFEWKPLTIKARIFPADNVDVPALLDELVTAGKIAERDDPKRHGLIRNFRDYQRPKKPNSSGLLAAEDREYVGLVEDQFGTDGGKSPQMEDGGGRMEDEDTSPPPVPVSEARAFFDQVWEAFPQNPTSNEARAEKAFNATKASDRPAILAAALRFRQWFLEDCASRKRSEDEGRKFQPHLATWLSGDWRKAGLLPLKADLQAIDPTLTVVRAGTPEFAALERQAHAKGKRFLVGDSGARTVRKAELEQAMAEVH